MDERWMSSEVWLQSMCLHTNSVGTRRLLLL